ncbi:cellulose biosynthesis cyclic di-GMP-binding regulatory protein BcsB [Agrilactobacillus yilanensis]|uniref:Cellulose biosynthesis cyclic di-GMP-binding regulatory protein BcsB n=1 Tax=Agrilactobacillus yilanensis TaxID=2485997 RepID=A0ABW4J7E6_9LACO|nr:cellulose biosynthesis cyclic di-GMP-binding regulatory protein BcsB [Agrilactobacillus yilanensis]
MFVNKSFIKKQNGIKRNVINKLLVVLSLGLGLWFFSSPANTAQAAETYTQPLQNQTVSLSGNAVETNLYFIKMGYWQVNKVTFNLNFQVSQLSNRQTSDITLSLNGVKFFSFRPEAETGVQTKQVEIPVDLLQDTNNLKITGQILNQTDDNSYNVATTPANWLTVYSGANINFDYDLQAPSDTINSFYEHFTGADTIVNHQAAIILPEQATNGELTASMYALSGQARTITTENEELPITTFDSDTANNADYQLIIARYDRLPDAVKQAIPETELANNQGLLKIIYTDKHHQLVLTAKTAAGLKKVARFVANQELMSETNQATKQIKSQTQTFTSSLQYDGHYQLTTADAQLTGKNHQEQAYFVNLPIDRTNANGSQIKIDFRYAKNLDFKKSLITVKINGDPVGSKQLTLKKADNDSLTVSLPENKALGNSFTIQIAFDLQLPSNGKTDNDQTPWATIVNTSTAEIKSKPVADLLFSNYPSTFLKNQTFNNIAVVRPKTLTSYDYLTLTNIFNLIGNFTQSNTGNITFYDQEPSKKVLENSSVIVFGTPKANHFIQTLNDKLYFKYNKTYTHFLSNEKLSIESNYGKTIGTNQLLRSPYNAEKALLVVTAAKVKDVYLAATQINYQKNIQNYTTADAIVVDQDNNHMSYRFKKHKATNQKQSVRQTITKHSQLIIYLVVALMILVILGFAIFMMLKKNGFLKHRGDSDEQ